MLDSITKDYQKDSGNRLDNINNEAKVTTEKLNTSDFLVIQQLPIKYTMLKMQENNTGLCITYTLAQFCVYTLEVGAGGHIINFRNKKTMLKDNYVNA